MERSNQPPKTEGCLAEGILVDLLYHRKERPSRSVSRDKCEPQAGPASGLSNSASKSSSASGDDVLLSESKTNSSAKGKDREGLPGSKSVARVEGNTSNEGGPEGSCRTNYEDQAGKEAQRKEASSDLSGVGLAHSIQWQPRPVGADAGEGANRATQSAQATSPVRKTEQDWPTFLRAIAEKASQWGNPQLRPIVEVGTPVARCPPHRSRRAILSHRALQINSLSHAPGETSFVDAAAPFVGRS